MIFFIYIKSRVIKKNNSKKSLFLWNSFTFTIVITHEIITFQDICMDKIPEDFTSIKDTYCGALSHIMNTNRDFYEDVHTILNRI